MLLFSHSKLVLTALLVQIIFCTFLVSMLMTHGMHVGPVGVLNICEFCKR